MRQIHIWPNHVRVSEIDLVLLRKEEEPVSQTLGALARLGLDTRPGNVVLHLDPRGEVDRSA